MGCQAWLWRKALARHAYFSCAPWAVLLKKGRHVLNPEYQISVTQHLLPLPQQDTEVRVRWAVGELLHVLSEQSGAAVWQHMKDPILDSIHNNFVSGKAPRTPMPRLTARNLCLCAITYFQVMP